MNLSESIFCVDLVKLRAAFSYEWQVAELKYCSIFTLPSSRNILLHIIYLMICYVSVHLLFHFGWASQPVILLVPSPPHVFISFIYILLSIIYNIQLYIFSYYHYHRYYYHYICGYIDIHMIHRLHILIGNRYIMVFIALILRFFCKQLF